ncbi:MAG TPA: hypothetical protein VFW47_00360 [Phenylobacterium sp.]|nr:hypothetical protein [Phenylobacterium sp.]
MSGQDMAKTIIPTMNRIDRATKRVIRERERKERAVQRAKRPEVAADAVARQDALIERLTRCHCVKYERKDWTEIAQRGLVEAAPRSNAREMAARKALARYEPGMIDSLFGLGKDRRRELAERVLAGAKADQLAYDKARRAAEAHNTDVNAAAGVLALDLGAIEITLKANIDREAIGAALEGFAVMQASPGRFIVFIDGLEYDAMPDETCMVQPSGGVAYAPLAEGNIHELHLSNVCSVSLRVGLEVLASIGVDAVEVVTRCHLPQSGARASQDEQYPVLYVKLPHAALSRMDFRKLEPVSTVTALGGRLDWDSTRGFAAIGIDDLKLFPEKPTKAATS